MRRDWIFHWIDEQIEDDYPEYGPKQWFYTAMMIVFMPFLMLLLPPGNREDEKRERDE